MSDSVPHMVEVLRHENGVFAQMAMCALEEADVHAYMRQETVTGIKVALDVMPASFPGLQFAIFVPNTEVGHAKDIVAGMPIDEESSRNALTWMHEECDPKNTTTDQEP
jgi:hypothetical protein